MSGSSTFLSPKLADRIRSTRTVSSELASAPADATPHGIAESLYGVSHHVHHGHSKDEGEFDTGGATSTVRRVLEKLHLRKASADTSEHGRDETGKKDKDKKNPATDQWAAMRPLTQRELVEVRGYGQWGQSTPSELFLNVSYTALQVQGYHFTAD
jgi:hypothetical protein